MFKRFRMATVSIVGALSTTACALDLEHMELGSGIGSDLHGGEGAALWLGASLKPRPLFGIEVQPHLAVLALDARDQRHGRPRGRTHVLLFENRIFWRNFYFGTGFSARDRDSDALSTRFNFVNGIGWHWKDVGISVRHLSNAGTGGLNRGENTFMITYRW